MERENDTVIKIIVKNDSKEVRVEIPWSTRTASLEVKEGSTPHGVLTMVEKLVNELNNIQ
jgi:hypothetical protein